MNSEVETHTWCKMLHESRDTNNPSAKKVRRLSAAACVVTGSCAASCVGTGSASSASASSGADVHSAADLQYLTVFYLQYA